MKKIRDWASVSWWRKGLLGVIVLFVVIQLVPYGRSHTNPPVTKALAFDTPQTADLFSGACGDCHSNLTSWPIDSNIAPFSWLVTNDVNGGRDNFNVSEWNRAQQPDIGDIADAINGGDMPPLQYKIMHSSGRLSDTEKQQLVDGLTKSIQADPPGQPATAGQPSSTGTTASGQSTTTTQTTTGG